MFDKMWISWEAVNGLLIDKELVIFGASELAEKMMKKIKKNPLWILDNSESKHGTEFLNAPIIAPQNKKHNKDYIVLISVIDDHKAILKQLEQLGFKPGIDLFFSPSLLNNKIRDDITDVKKKALFTSPSSLNLESNDSGGGLYLYDFQSYEVKKLINGRFCEFEKYEDLYYIIDHYNGVHVINEEFEVVDKYPILPWSTPHGLSVDGKQGRIFVANTSIDSISVIDLKTGEHIDEIKINPNKEYTEYDNHHINDLQYDDEYLYVSMFSFSGSWKKGFFDGGIAKLNLKTKKIESYPVQNMWMPHSVQILNGEIHFVDSMKGDVYRTSNKVVTSLPGFIRGLAHDGNYYYIGQSEHRYFERMKGVKNAIHVNAGIYIFDSETKACRFHAFNRLTNIHSIMIL